MKRIKDLKRQILRIFSRFKWLIFGVLTMLVIINTLLTPISSNAQSILNSYTATVNEFNGTVKIFPEGDPNSSQTPTRNETTIRGTESKRPDTLWVAGTSNSAYESWAHLQLQQDGTAVDPILQAGTDSTDTEYTFPCGVAIGGSIVTGWGLRQESPRGCENIDLQHPAWKTRKGLGLSNPYLTEESSVKEFQKKTEIAQNNFSQSRVRISKAKDLTLVYAYNLDGNLVIDVLVGEVKIQPANEPSLSLTAGSRYVSFGNIKPGVRSNINPSEIAKLRPVQIFLDSTKWGKDAKPLIERFRQILVSVEPSAPSLIAQELLDAHNKCRAKVNVPPLQWSSQVATYAQEWADNLSRTDTFDHRPNNEQIHGENLATGASPTDVVNSWCAEEEKYNPETGQCRDGNPDSCGHYTQIVWKNTTQLGCGTASHSQWGKVWVCNYNPRGNFRGQRPY
jgi:uncharacterized protein YkwD